MDPHFPEYLAAIAGMHDLYGEAADDRPSDFHDVSAPAAVAAPEVADVLVADVATPVVVSGRPHWDSEPSEEFAGSGIWTI